MGSGFIGGRDFDGGVSNDEAERAKAEALSGNPKINPLRTLRQSSVHRPRRFPLVIRTTADDFMAKFPQKNESHSATPAAVLRWIQKSCMTLSTLYLGNDGTIVYKGHAEFFVSTVFQVMKALRHHRFHIGQTRNLNRLWASIGCEISIVVGHFEDCFGSAKPTYTHH